MKVYQSKQLIAILFVCPNELKTIHGIARNSHDVDIAITKHVDTSLSRNLNTCPRVVSLKSQGNTVPVPARLCNLSACPVNIPPKSLLCTLNSVKILGSRTPDPSKKSEKEPHENFDLEQLVVSVDTDDLSPDQVLKVKQVIGSWSHIFFQKSH